MNETLKKLKVLDGVRYVGWNLVREIVNALGTIQVVEKMWHDKWKQDHPEYYPLDLEDIKTWSTYRECAEFSFKYRDLRTIECEAHIWDGDLVDGFPKDRKFTVKMIVPMSFLEHIEDTIEYAFHKLLVREYDAHLEEQKKAWMNGRKKEILEMIR